MKAILIIALALAAANAASLNSLEKPGFPEEGRIINGHETAVGAAPYIVSFRTNIHFCGGAIIDPSWVVTAGHCLVYNNFYIVGGLHDRNNETGAQVREITSWQYIVHEGYNGGVGPNDNGLVYVSPPFDLSASAQVNKNPISKVTLASENSTQTGKGVLYGWGRNSSGLLPNRLNYLDVDIIGYAECKQNLPPLAPIDPVNICTYTPNKTDGPCIFDSGGPLVRKIGNNVVQVGIVSWGYTPCAAQKAPSMYTRVSAYLDWIESKQRNFEAINIPV